MQLFHAFAAEELTHQDAGPHAQPGNAEDYQVHHRSRNAFRCQSSFADKPACNDAVHGVVGKLEAVAENQRNGILHQVGKGFALSHVGGGHADQLLKKRPPYCITGGHG